MDIQDIARLKKENDLVFWVLKQPNKKDTWLFLRRNVEYSQDSATCGRCGEITVTFESPYNAPYPGWCIDCVLVGFAHNMPKWDEWNLIEGFQRGFPYYKEWYSGIPIG